MMCSRKSFRPRPLVAAAGTLIALALPASALAQATRTWVSGVGDDANPCSRTAPCKTFAGAISKTAAGGEIDALDPGGFGALTITKSITIDGGGGQVASSLVSGTNAFVIAAGSSDRVIIRNMRFQGLGTGLDGIKVISAASVDLENVDINGFHNNGVEIAATAPNVVTLNNSRIGENQGNGVLNNGTDPSGNDWMNITNSEIDDNGGNGVQTGTGGSAVVLSDIVNSDITNNGFSSGIGVYSDGSAAVSAITHDEVVANGVGLETNPSNGGSILSFGNNDVFENYTNVAPGTSIGSLSPMLASIPQLKQIAKRHARAWKRRHHKHRHH
jgi:hypothetical protein